MFIFIGRCGIEADATEAIFVVGVKRRVCSCIFQSTSKRFGLVSYHVRPYVVQVSVFRFDNLVLDGKICFHIFIDGHRVFQTYILPLRKVGSSIVSF